MRSLALAACLTLVACGHPMGTPDGGSGGGSATGGGHTGGGSAMGGGSGGGGTGTGGGGSMMTHDAGQSCADPVPLTLGVISPMEKIDAPNKRVYFSITLDAGAFLDIATKANPANETGVVDTAVTLLDATGMTELASDDDAFPRLSTDSELFYRVQTPQTLCIRVEDFDTWSNNGMSQVADSNIFRLTVSAMSPSMLNNADTETNDTIMGAQTGTMVTASGGATGAAIIYGGLDTANDVDVYKFTMPTGAAQLQVELPPNGDAPAPMVSTYGSTMARFAVKVTKMDGTIVGAITPPATASQMSQSIGVEVTPGQPYFVWVQRSLPAGANDFYATQLNFTTDNPPELEMVGASTNDTLPTAETLALTAGGPKQQDGFILGHLTPSDVDYFRFPAGAGDSIVLACSAARDASGLTGTKFELVDGAGTSLQSETETNTADVLWEMGGSKPAVVAPDAGTYALKVSGATQDAMNTGNYYRCGLHLTSP